MFGYKEDGDDAICKKCSKTTPMRMAAHNGWSLSKSGKGYLCDFCTEWKRQEGKPIRKLERHGS